jgi:hypothetical protein
MSLREAMTLVAFISVGLETEAKELRIPVCSTVLYTVTLGSITVRMVKSNCGRHNGRQRRGGWDTKKKQKQK